MRSSESVAGTTARARTGWLLVAILSVGTGLAGLRYLLPHPQFPTPLPNFTARHPWLVSHAVCASIAILCGPWQFSTALRRRSLTAHRWVGRLYCAAVLAGWIASAPIAAHAQTGRLASTGFLALGALWIATTTAAYATARRREIDRHREWMTRSFALTAAAITLRLYLPIAILTHAPFEIAYGVIAWLCWVPNLLFAEWLIRRNRSTIQLPPESTATYSSGNGPRPAESSSGRTRTPW